MELFNKILVLGLIWVGIGFVGFWLKTIIFDIKLVCIDPKRTDEIIADAARMISGGIIDVHPSDVSDDEKVKSLRKEWIANGLLSIWIRQWIMWPATFSTMDQAYAETYKAMVDKYGNSEKTEELSQ